MNVHIDFAGEKEELKRINQSADIKTLMDVHSIKNGKKKEKQKQAYQKHLKRLVCR